MKRGMTIRTITEAPEPALSDALEEFERTFNYPLGAGRSFRISHGRDYARFFRAIDADSGAVFIAIGKDGRVRGTLGVAVRSVQFPDGECRRAAYLGDLKTAPGVGRGWALLRLGAEVTAWSKAHGAVVAYGVVMGGTGHQPSAYTGKLGIYPFRKVHDLTVLRIPAGASHTEPDRMFETEVSVVEERFRILGKSAFVPHGGSSSLRSVIRPIALISPDGSACGVLEDTRQAKRLIEEDGSEMRTAHLSKFAYADLPSAIRLVRQALARCVSQSLASAMFVAVPAGDTAAFLALLEDVSGVVQASAAIYGTWPDLAGEQWRISTAEI
jgi:hypothetical protein